MTADDLRALDAHGWELYHVDEDPTESRDVAAENLPRLRELIALWYVEAGRYGVLPIDGRGQQRFAEPRPQISAERTSYRYFPGTDAVPESAAARLLNRSFVITAEVEIPEGGASGVLLAHGGNTGGYSFFVQGGKLHYVYNYVAIKEFHVESHDTIPTGRHALRLEFERTGEADPRRGKGAPGHVRLLVDDRLVGEGDIPVTIPLLIGVGGGLVCGRSSASPITDAYRPPFAFTGVLEEVRLEIGREALVRDEEAELRMAMGRE
jgi:arylsulfatase